MRTLILAIFLSLSFTSLLDSQLIKPRNPIMVINCEEEDSALKRKLIQLREHGCSHDTEDEYEKINGLCYLIIDCENPIAFPEGWTSLEIFYDEDDSPTLCILVPDCSGAIGCDEEVDCAEVSWNPYTLTCDCIKFTDNDEDEGGDVGDSGECPDIEDCGTCKGFNIEDILGEDIADVLGFTVIGRIAVGNCQGGGQLSCVYVQYEDGEEVVNCFMLEFEITEPNQVLNFEFTIPEDAISLQILGCRSAGSTAAIRLCILDFYDSEEEDPFTSNPCGCPDVLVDIYPSMEDEVEVDIDQDDSDGECIEFVTTPCYDGDLDIQFPSLNCQGLTPDELVLYRILIIGEDANIGEALTIEDLINCDLAGGQDFVRELLGAGLGDGVGWIFKDVDELELEELDLGFDLPPSGTPVILVEFFRNPFEESVIILSNRPDGKQNTIIIPACQQVIPTMSTWGFIVLGLGFLIFGSLMFRHRLSAKLI